MTEFLFASQNLPFTISILIMFGITLLEFADMILGIGISDFFESVVPDIDIDVDGGTDALKILDWLRIGQLPLLVIVIVFLTAFGLIGWGIQSVAHNLKGAFLSGMIASLPALIFSIPVVNVVGGLLAKIVPRDETEAVSEKSFVGRTAKIVLGTARVGKPAQAKLRDKHGTTHYVMIEPDKEGEAFEEGDTVLIVSQEAAFFIGIRSFDNYDNEI